MAYRHLGMLYFYLFPLGFSFWSIDKDGCVSSLYAVEDSLSPDCPCHEPTAAAVSAGAFVCENKGNFSKTFCGIILGIFQTPISYCARCLSDENSFGLEGVRDRNGDGMEDVMHHILHFDRAFNI